jgi:hypothetical protein
MSASREVLALYEQWRLHTEMETRAIDASAWEDVVRIQADKASLQPAIIRASDSLQVPNCHAAEDRARIEELLLNLIQSELSNRQQIHSRLAETRGQREALNRSANQLRDIRRAYGRSTTSEA